MTIRDSAAHNNTGHGLQSWLNCGEARNISILVERFRITGAGSLMLGGKPRSGGFVFGRIHPPTGSSIVIRDSTVEHTQLFGICEHGNGCPSHIVNAAADGIVDAYRHLGYLRRGAAGV